MANKMIFQNKSAQYSEGRPSYAPQMLHKILDDILNTNSVVADIGSGTGMLSKVFVEKSLETYAVEPDGDMRKKAEEKLLRYSNYHSIDASAEQTELADRSVSLIVAASAFHWFDAKGFKQECMRILNEEGVVCVIYNVRVQDEFSIKQCDICKKYCDGFVSLTHGYDKTLQLIGEFFDGSYETYEYDFPLEYTKKKFISRCLSSSYAPLPDSSNYEPYVREITDLIGTTFKDDIFEITNKTVMFVGRMRKVTP